MAFKKVESTSGGQVPFFTEWSKELSSEYCSFLNNTLVEPKWIKLVQSSKGFMLNFDDTFMIFVWKNSSIGSALKKMINDGEGYALMICFTPGKKGLTYDLGFDDDVEVTVEQDRVDDGMYYFFATTEKPPIAPRENRTCYIHLPKPEVSSSLKSSPAKKAPAKPS